MGPARHPEGKKQAKSFPQCALNKCVLAGHNQFKWPEASKRAVLPNLIPRKPVGQRMVGPLAARGRDATAEADLAEALRRSRLTAQREKRKRAAADRRSFNVACTLSGLRAELDRREQRRQEAQYAGQLHEAIVKSRQGEEERRARAALNEARDVARAIDASLINHTRWGQLPDDVIELVLDIKQEERVQHELVKPASSLCCMPCDMPCGMDVVASWEYALSAYMNEVD